MDHKSKGEGPGLEAWIREVWSMSEMRPAIRRGCQAQEPEARRPCHCRQKCPGPHSPRVQVPLVLLPSLALLGTKFQSYESVKCVQWVMLGAGPDRALY